MANPDNPTLEPNIMTMLYTAGVKLVFESNGGRPPSSSRSSKVINLGANSCVPHSKFVGLQCLWSKVSINPTVYCFLRFGGSLADIVRSTNRLTYLLFQKTTNGKGKG